MAGVSGPTVEEVLQAIDSLYHHSADNKEGKKKASIWLTELASTVSLANLWYTLDCYISPMCEYVIGVGVGDSRQVTVFEERCGDQFFCCSNHAEEDQT